MAIKWYCTVLHLLFECNLFTFHAKGQWPVCRSSAQHFPSSVAFRKGKTRFLIGHCVTFKRQKNVIHVTHQVSRWHLVFGVKSKIWAHFVQEFITVGLNKTYLYIIVISSTNKYRKHKNSMLIWALPVDEMIVTFKFITVNWWLWRGHWFVVVGFLGGGVWGGGGTFASHLQKYVRWASDAFLLQMQRGKCSVFSHHTTLTLAW